MTLVYSDITSNRLEYTLDFIFNEVLAVGYRWTNSIDAFNAFVGPKICYSTKSLGGVKITPVEVLFDNDVKPHEVRIGSWDDLPTLYATEDSDIPFDIFAAIFYLISRYEEYLPSARDSHDRFLASSSVLIDMVSLQKPIVDLWCLRINKLLYDKDSLSRTYNYVSTIDVDNAYAYKYKSFGIKLGATVKSIMKMDTADLKRRFGSYFRKKTDPYDTYDLIQKVHQDHTVQTIFFFLLSDRNEWDKNLRFTNKYLRALISALQRENGIGIHPGYLSYLDANRTLEEKIRLEDILENEVLNSRQHFLRIKFPETYRNLVSVGIEHDYSLGYAEKLGFRAGTCTPFKFFDLENDKVSGLTIHSSAIMDASLNRYLNYSPEEAVKEAENIIKEVKGVNGELITIWHNETLSDLREWKGWRNVFNEIVSIAK